ncbi:MAG: PilN domain-containing protein [Pseudomonadota bacterium]
MQQVNLYQPILRKQERVFSLKTILQGNLLILLVLGAIQGVTLYQTQQLRDQHSSLQKTLTERSRTLTELQQKFPPKEKDPALEQTLEQQRALLAHRRQLIRALQHQRTGADGKPGFSEQLSALARQDVEALWLEQIRVRSGKQLALRGWATAPEEVPRLVKRLAGEPSFSGTSFRRAQISRDEEERAVVGFQLNTDDANRGEQP